MSKEQRINPRLTIAIAVLAVVFLALSILSASYSVARASFAIDSIGKVELTDKVYESIVTAEDYYSRLDDNIGLKARITNYQVLKDKEAEFVRLAIKELYLAGKHNESQDVIDSLRITARALFDEFFTESESHLISNYQDLLDAETAAGSSLKPATTTNTTTQSEEEIELC